LRGDILSFSRSGRVQFDCILEEHEKRVTPVEQLTNKNLCMSSKPVAEVLLSHSTVRFSYEQ
jgi:hypothetical protein